MMRTLGLLRLIFVTLFAIPLGAWQFSEWLHANQAQAWPVHAGTVVAREEIRLWGGIPAGRITVRPNDASVLVSARVTKTELATVPDTVRIHARNDHPEDGVIEGHHTSPLSWIMLWGIPIGLWGWYFCSRRR